MTQPFEIVLVVLALLCVVATLFAAVKALLSYSRRTSLEADLAEKKLELEIKNIEFTARKLELEAKNIELTGKKIELEVNQFQLEIAKTSPVKELSMAEREAMLDKVTEEAYFVAEQAAKNNEKNGIKVIHGWKLDIAVKFALEKLANVGITNISPRELALRIEVHVASHEEPKQES